MWSKGLPWLALILLTLLFVFFLTLILLDYFQEYTVPAPIIDTFLEDISLQEGWDPIEGIPLTTERGKCLLYPTFSLNTSLVDSIEPIANVEDLPPEFRCDDGYSMPLQKRTRTCGVEECRGSDGGIYFKHDVEEYYVKCGEVEPCSSGRSAVIFNFYPPGLSGATCLESNSESFLLGSCSSNVENQRIFLNVDQVPIADGVTLVRIRAPGSDHCLVPSEGGLASKKCLSRTDQGYSWVFLPRICDPDNEKICYEPQITTLPIDLDPNRLVEKDYLLAVASTLDSLQAGPNLLPIIQPYQPCNLESGHCYRKSGIVSGYSYKSFL